MRCAPTGWAGASSSPLGAWFAAVPAAGAVPIRYRRHAQPRIRASSSFTIRAVTGGQYRAEQTADATGAEHREAPPRLRHSPLPMPHALPAGPGPVDVPARELA